MGGTSAKVDHNQKIKRFLHLLTDRSMIKKLRLVTFFILTLFYVLDVYLAILHFSNITHRFSAENQTVLF